MALTSAGPAGVARRAPFRILFEVLPVRVALPAAGVRDDSDARVVAQRLRRRSAGNALSSEEGGDPLVEEGRVGRARARAGRVSPERREEGELHLAFAFHDARRRYSWE